MFVCKVRHLDESMIARPIMKPDRTLRANDQVHSEEHDVPCFQASLRSYVKAMNRTGSCVHNQG